MRKALGATVEDECRLGVHKIANVRLVVPPPLLLVAKTTVLRSHIQLLEGNVGLLFTDETPKVVTEWFASFKRADYARSGNVVSETFTLPSGPSSLPPFPSPLFPSKLTPDENDEQDPS